MSTTLETVIPYLAATTGIQLPDTLYRSVDGFINQRCAALGITVGEYIGRLDRDSDEYGRFINSVTVNETYFFREETQFRAIERDILPGLSQSGKTIKIWSSSCSTGEEAISLYCLADDVIGKDRVSMYASDINDTVMSKFENGIYGKNSFRQDGSGFHRLVENRGSRGGEGLCMGREILKGIKRRVINLNTLPDDSIPRDFDIIFMRNTIIYFNVAEREKIIGGIINHLGPGGLLFTSVTEVALVAHPELAVDSIGPVYFFRRKTVEEKQKGAVITEPLIDRIAHEAPDIKTVDTRVITMKSILSMANHKLNNPLYKLAANPAYRAAIDMMEALYLINRGRRAEAIGMIERLESKNVEKILLCYLRAQANRAGDDSGCAVEYFSRALDEQADFWPARFYRAMLLLGQGNRVRAVSDLGKTLRDIESYIAGGEYGYQVLMEGFNGKYFKTICEKWIDKLQSSGK